MERLPECIYCRSKDHDFDREHVIPQGLGTFEPESFILYEAVCKPCNGYFGRTLEQSLSRDSFEALLRLRYGVKPPTKTADLQYRRIELRVGQVGPWLGATVVLVPDKSGMGIDAVPVPQVAFRWKGAINWAFLLEKQLSDENVVGPYRGAKPGTLEICLMGPYPSDRERLVEKLKILDI